MKKKNSPDMWILSDYTVILCFISAGKRSSSPFNYTKRSKVEYTKNKESE